MKTSIPLRSAAPNLARLSILHLEFVAKAHWELLGLYPSLVLEQAAGFRTERQNRVGRLGFRECLR